MRDQNSVTTSIFHVMKNKRTIFLWLVNDPTQENKLIFYTFWYETNKTFSILGFAMISWSTHFFKAVLLSISKHVLLIKRYHSKVIAEISRFTSRDELYITDKSLPSLTLQNSLKWKCHFIFVTLWSIFIAVRYKDMVSTMESLSFSMDDIHMHVLWIKIISFLYDFHWQLLLLFRSAISHHWFR